MKRVFKSLAVLVVTFLLGTVVATTPVDAAPPANFQVEPIVTTGLNGPSGFEIAPDGRIFVLERTGKIKIIKNGQLLPTPFADLPSIASGDRGLIGIAFDPEFGIANHYVYFYYTGLDKLNRLVRFDASTDVGQNGPYQLYQTNSLSQELHVGGSIRFGPDGKLYFAVGDNGYPPNAQNLGNPHGKILRINKDGSIPLDNPFYGQPGALPEIWAYGMRNPWRFQFDSTTGELYGGDVGDFTWEEVNHIQKGKNYGWPTFEGYCNAMCGNTVTPIYTYNHDGQSSAVTGGPIYRSNMFPEEYKGSLFFGDYARGFIKRATLDAAGNASSIIDFDTNAGSVVDMKIAPDGSMYYITYYPGRLYKVSYTTGNHNPVANATADVTKGVDPLTVHFSSAGSNDPDGTPITYLWNLGDGTTSTAANPVKTYTQKGTYTVELSVSDGVNTSHGIPVVIQVGIPPTVNIGEPADGSTYKAGDVIHYTASSLDGAGFDINDSNISTEIILHHDTHIHPFLGPIIGRQGTFTIPTTGEASPNTWFEIKVTVTDSNGLATTKSNFIYPVKSMYTLQTEPAGLTVLLDGVPRTTPTTIEGVVNFEREFNTHTIQSLNGKQYQFERWSDNLPQKHFVATKQNPTTYTAVFREAAPFNAEYFNNVELQGAPVLTRQDQTIDFDWGDGSPTPEININGFSVRWTKNQYFAAGKYKFTSATDDGLRLYVDNELLIDRWTGGVVAESATKVLTAGEHAIRFEYREDGGGAYAKLNWDLTADQPVAATDYQAEYFNNKTLTGNPVLTRNETAIDFGWNDGSPDPLVTNDNFSARYTKTADLAAGTYQFTTSSDDGVRLYVDNELLIDKFIDQGTTTYTATKALTAGSHTIRLEYFENGGGAVLHMNYVKIGDTTPPPATGEYTAEYFTNKTLTGAPILTRNETAVNYEWGGGSPDPVVPNDNFSARWTKTEAITAATAGTYEFSATGDDGVRVKVDGVTIIDKFVDQGTTTYKASTALAAGNHTIVFEYYENGGGAVAKFSYVKVGDTTPPATTGFTGEYFNNQDLFAPVTMTRNDATINFDWGGGSPDPLLNANNFSARWTKTDVFTAGNYEFTTTADDGVRIKVDGETIIDKWVAQAAPTYKATKALTAGNHTIVVEYFEAGGGAKISANWVKVSDTTTPPPTGKYQAKYWNLPAAIAKPDMPTTPATLIRDEDVIDNTWNDDAPAATINANGYVVQWTKTQAFEAATYKFTTVSDDGIRVFVDDQPVIDQWNDHGSTTHTGQKTLTAGDHVIRVEYYENTGGAVAKFNFEKVTGTDPNPNPNPQPGGETFAAEFFNNLTLTGPAVLARADAVINYVLDLGSPDALVNVDNFSARWTKTKTYAAGTYNFTIKSDDGVRFYVDNQLVVDDWTDHAMKTYQPAVPLTAGAHTLKIEYYEHDGGAVMIFQEN
jgi:glucose/arabinose dehydrogenase